MKQVIQQMSFIIPWIFIVGSFIACTKEKEPLPQHSGQTVNNIYKLNPIQLDGKTFLLHTGEAKHLENTTFSESVEITVEKFWTGSHPFVEYTVPKEIETLLGHFEFIGRPHHTYRMQIELNDESLWLYAIAPRVDISNQHSHIMEATGMSNENGEGLYKIPIMGIPITYMAVEVLKDSYGQQTSRTTEYIVLRQDMADHVILNHNQKSQFKYLEKLDVYPSDLFEGDWYFAETIVATQAGNEDAQGASLIATDTDLVESTKIRFLRAEDKIRGINVNIDSRVDNNDEVNFKTVIEIPVAWKDYRIMRRGNTLAFQEEETPDINWRDKRFGQFNFNEIRTASIGSQINNTALAERRLVEIEIKPDYRSYTIFLPRSNFRVRHSFLRIRARSYQPRKAHKDDMLKFGYFTTFKEVLDTYELERMEDLEDLRYMNLFDTSSGEIVFHFTKTSPEHLRVVGRRAVEKWNKIFQEAGTGVEIKLDEEDVNLGDLRYNAINIIESLSGEGSPFGFGPAVIDPQTGEIIAATANVWSTPIRDTIIYFLRHYVRSEIGLIEEKYIFSPPETSQIGYVGSPYWSSYMGLVQMNLDGKLEELLKTQSKFEGTPYLQESTYNFFEELKNQYSHYEEIYMQRLQEAVAKHGKLAYMESPFIKQLGRLCVFSFGTLHEGLIDEINSSKECDPFREYIAELQQTGEVVNEQEHSVLASCANKLLINVMTTTLLHEFGHNFGYRHNFMGSNDVPNYASHPETGEEVESSTVMEYLAFGNRNLLVSPGPYDLAITRFGYANTVELEDGTLVELDVDYPIHVNMANRGLRRKPYKFCTDEHAAFHAGAGWSQYTNPMCDLWDRGRNAEEVMEFTSVEFSESVALHNRRFNRIWPPSNARHILGMGLINSIRRMRHLRKAKLFYDHWRIEVAHFLDVDEGYLEEFNSNQYQDVLASMSQSDELGSDGRPYSEIFSEFQPAADKSFEMLMDVAFMPNRYCGVQDGGVFDIVELEDIRQTGFWRRNKSVVQSCSDPVAEDIVRGWDKGDVLFETGYYLKDLKFDMNPIKEMEPLDITGTRWDRLFAMLFLSQRYAYSSLHRSIGSTGLFPNFFDEPEKRDEVINRITERVIQGVNPKDLELTPSHRDLLGEKIEDIDSYLDNRKFFRFKHEKDVIGELFYLSLQGLMIPGKTAINASRLRLFNMFMTDEPQTVQQAVQRYHVGNGRYIVAFQSATVAVELLSSLNNIMLLKESWLMDLFIPIVGMFVSTYDLLGEDTMTFQEYSQFILRLSQLINDETLSPWIQMEIYNKFSLDIQVFSYIEGLSEEERAQLMAPQQANGVVSGGDMEEENQSVDDMRVIYQRLGAPVFMLVKSSDLKNFFNETVGRNNKLVRNFQNNELEYEAQENLLTSIMYMLTQE